MTPVVERIDGHAAEVLAAIHADAFAGGEVWSAQALRALLSGPGTVALCARVDEGPAGFAMLRAAGDEAEILTIAVIPALARRGVGAALLRAVVATAEALGCARLFLDVSEANGAARALYDRFGFQRVGRRRDYYADGSAALVLVRALASPS